MHDPDVDFALPGDRLTEAPADWAPNAQNYPPVSAMLGTAVDSALLLLEARRWWLDEYHVDHPMVDAEVEALNVAIESLERALDYQRRCRAA